MRDERLEKLAGVLLGHSLRLQPGDIVQVRADMAALPLVESLFRLARKLKIFLLVQWQNESVSRMNYELMDVQRAESEKFLELTNRWEMERSADITAYLTIRAPENDRELSTVDPELLKMSARASEAVSDRIINQRQWVLFYWPTAGQAQNAGMPYEKWFDHVLNVCLIDYEKLYKAEQSLAKRMEAADMVSIKAPGTDLSFSIKGIPAVCCYGIRNLPDGEVYTAPLRDSVEGHITYNVPSNQWGHTFSQIAFTFEKGRIVKCSSADRTDLLEKILDSDNGARYIGEFSFGVNPLLPEPMGSTLFDEKICGSIHLTPGRAYAKADNGNKSSLHWDLIQIQRPEYGGGEIYFDNELIRRDGLFVPKDLQLLNP